MDRHAGSAAVVRGQADNKTADGEPRACAGSVGQAGVRIERCAHLDTALLAAPLTIPTALPRKLLTAQRGRGGAAGAAIRWRVRYGGLASHNSRGAGSGSASRQQRYSQRCKPSIEIACLLICLHSPVEAPSSALANSRSAWLPLAGAAAPGPPTPPALPPLLLYLFHSDSTLAPEAGSLSGADPANQFCRLCIMVVPSLSLGAFKRPGEGGRGGAGHTPGCRIASWGLPEPAWSCFAGVPALLRAVHWP